MSFMGRRYTGDSPQPEPFLGTVPGDVPNHDQLRTLGTVPNRDPVADIGDCPQSRSIWGLSPIHYARAARHRALPRRARAARRRATASSACGSRARSCCAPSIRRSTAVAGQTVVRRCGGSASASSSSSTGELLPGAAPDDRGAAALEGRRAPRSRARIGLAAFDFATGTLLLTEAGTKKRASLHLVRGRGGARATTIRGGLEVLDATLDGVRARRSPRENHTLKRALTDPRLFSGIGNAYSDEILHRARLSPVQLTPRPRRRGDRRGCTPRRAGRARASGSSACGGRPATEFPEKVTAFRDGDGRARPLRQAVPGCGAPVQRIVYAENETQLLSALPDRRAAARRPVPLAAARKDWPRRSRSSRN